MTATADAALFRGMTPEQVEQQYNPRASVPNFQALAVERTADSAKARQELKCVLDVRYGENPLETLDIFLPANAKDAPVQVYFHGGYWRAMDKSDFSFVARPFVAAGAICVLANYDLCPNVTLDTIVEETRRCIAWVWRNIAEYGGDSEKIHVSGSSAGAHMVAMALAHDWRTDGLTHRIIKSATPITGVYDLEPVLHISVNQEIRLDAEMAERNSPINLTPLCKAPVLVAVGGAETKSWIAMSEAYAELCRDSGLLEDYLVMPGDNHFTVTARLGDADNALVQSMLKMMELSK